MGKKYASVTEMLKAVGADTELRQEFKQLSAATRLSRLLFALRCKAGMTQAAIADCTGCAQSVISRIENAEDISLTIGDLLKYAEALDLQLHIGFGDRKMKIADRFRYHLHSFSKCARELLEMAGDDLQILQGATDMFCGSARQFCKLLENSMDKLTVAAEKQGLPKLEEQGTLVIESPQTEEARDDCLRC